tara:strand:- start:522 stop:716 length:195 start_codon:yes stop_codon:yes gene_type:complete
MGGVKKIINGIFNEEDPQKVINLWTSINDTEGDTKLTLEELIMIHKKCGEKIINAANSIKENEK